ncbi:ASTRA-associated protein 1 [Frankliniella fusca]|uniref:ASTRA-associated protein 1 n=1 Tax=Frankliniella fusca TaxID=407009 RepID=A0AAE1I4D6_9NEOP|nr:ASTRA-associated protein 1 [Frankliniella fusca]
MDFQSTGNRPTNQLKMYQRLCGFRLGFQVVEMSGNLPEVVVGNFDGHAVLGFRGHQWDMGIPKPVPGEPLPRKCENMAGLSSGQIYMEKQGEMTIHFRINYL